MDNCLSVFLILPLLLMSSDQVSYSGYHLQLRSDELLLGIAGWASLLLSLWMCPRLVEVGTSFFSGTLSSIAKLSQRHPCLLHNVCSSLNWASMEENMRWDGCFTWQLSTLCNLKTSCIPSPLHSYWVLSLMSVQKSESMYLETASFSWPWAFMHVCKHHRWCSCMICHRGCS